MQHNFTDKQIEDLETLISLPRFKSYLKFGGGDRFKAMQLYCWNADISAAFLVMLNYCETAIRNGTVEALKGVYGIDWHTNPGFIMTLRNPETKQKSANKFSPKNHLMKRTTAGQSADEIVPELSLAFWRSLFISKQQNQIWNKHFATVFPGYNNSISLTLTQAREALYNDIDIVRRFRNRVAHHERIFTGDIQTLFSHHAHIRRIIEWRRPGLAIWLDGVETVTKLLKENSRP